MLVISYNPGYQSVLKDLKHSTKQRFVAIEFDYPKPDLEETILQEESGVDAETAAKLVKIAEKVRNLRTHGLEEGVSTRLLVYAGQLIAAGVEPLAACESHDLQADHRRRRDAALDRRDHRDAVLDARRAPRRRQR